MLQYLKEIKAYLHSHISTCTVHVQFACRFTNRNFNGYFTSCSPLRYSWHKQSNTVLFSSKSSFRGKHCRTDGKTWNPKSKTYNANMYTKTHKGLLLIQYPQFCFTCIKLINALDLMTRFGKYMDLRLNIGTVWLTWLRGKDVLLALIMRHVAAHTLSWTRSLDVLVITSCNVFSISG